MVRDLTPDRLGSDAAWRSRPRRWGDVTFGLHTERDQFNLGIQREAIQRTMRFGECKLCRSQTAGPGNCQLRTLALIAQQCDVSELSLRLRHTLRRKPLERRGAQRCKHGLYPVP